MVSFLFVIFQLLYICLFVFFFISLSLGVHIIHICSKGVMDHFSFHIQNKNKLSLLEALCRIVMKLQQIEGDRSNEMEDVGRMELLKASLL